MSLAAVFVLVQESREVPEGDDWLGAAERETQARLKVPKRRADWRLGRWTAKRAVASMEKDPAASRSLAELVRTEVRAAPSGVPELWRDGGRLPLALSLSHSANRALVALAASGVALGCDLEEVVPRSRGFLEDYFTPSERAALVPLPPTEGAARTAVVWTAKESVLKALGEGLRVSLQALSVVGIAVGGGLVSPDWQPFAVQMEGSADPWRGFWRRDGGQVAAVVATPAPAEPVDLAAVMYRA